jgi:hypothetical protein
MVWGCGCLGNDNVVTPKRAEPEPSARKHSGSVKSAGTHSDRSAASQQRISRGSSRSIPDKLLLSEAQKAQLKELMLTIQASRHGAECLLSVAQCMCLTADTILPEEVARHLFTTCARVGLPDMVSSWPGVHHMQHIAWGCCLLGTPPAHPSACLNNAALSLYLSKELPQVNVDAVLAALEPGSRSLKPIRRTASSSLKKQGSNRLDAAGRSMSMVCMDPCC